MIFFSALFYLPQFFQVALAYSPIRSGIFLLPVLVSQTVASFVAVSLGMYLRKLSSSLILTQGQIISRTGRYRVCISIYLNNTHCLISFVDRDPRGVLRVGCWMRLCFNYQTFHGQGVDRLLHASHWHGRRPGALIPVPQSDPLTSVTDFANDYGSGSS